MIQWICAKQCNVTSFDWMIKSFTMEEIKHAVWECDSFKSPGLDDINVGFVKDFWDILKEDLGCFFNEFHRNGKLTKGLNNTYIALIQEIDSPQRLSDFHPIALVGCLYKILSKFWPTCFVEVLGVLSLNLSQLYPRKKFF